MSKQQAILAAALDIVTPNAFRAYERLNSADDTEATRNQWRDALMTRTGITRVRARQVVAKAIRIRRGEGR